MISISAVERDTGIGRDTLRVWERRYGFPSPLRDDHGDRCYPAEQVEKLRLIKRLIDQGSRPMKLVRMSIDDLEALARESPSINAARGKIPNFDRAELDRLVGLLQLDALAELQSVLRDRLVILGLEQFVVNTIAPLTVAVGEAWATGDIKIYQEHQYTQCVDNILSGAIATISSYDRKDKPVILLTTFPGELHALGLLMAECMLAASGARCVSLGTQTPIIEIVEAVKSHKPDIIGLSFSSHFNRRLAVDGLIELRSTIPEGTLIWVGGQVQFLEKFSLPGVVIFQNLDEINNQIKILISCHR